MNELVFRLPYGSSCDFSEAREMTNRMNGETK